MLCYWVESKVIVLSYLVNHININIKCWKDTFSYLPFHFITSHLTFLLFFYLLSTFYATKRPKKFRKDQFRNLFQDSGGEFNGKTIKLIAVTDIEIEWCDILCFCCLIYLNILRLIWSEKHVKSISPAAGFAFNLLFYSEIPELILRYVPPTCAVDDGWHHHFFPSFLACVAFVISHDSRKLPTQTGYTVSTLL